MTEESEKKRRIIKVGKQSYTPEELGLEYIMVNGRRYLDVTPLWIDSNRAQEIKSRMFMDR